MLQEVVLLGTFPLLLLQSRQRVVDECDEEVEEDDERDADVDEHDKRSPRSSNLPRVLVVHVHVVDSKPHERRPQRPVVVQVRPERQVRDAGEGQDEGDAEEAERGELAARVADGGRHDGDRLAVAEDVQQTERDDEGGEGQQVEVDGVGARQLLEAYRLV